MNFWCHSKISFQAVLPHVYELIYSADRKGVWERYLLSLFVISPLFQENAIWASFTDT